MMVELLAWPCVAGIVLAGIHAWFGQHVLARGIVFVDLALAQMAALGFAAAILAGHPIESAGAYAYALAFAFGAALVFAALRPLERTVPQEAVIGIVYAFSAALCVLVLDRAPHGAENVKQLLVGSILSVTPGEVGALAALYAAIGALHAACRRPLVAASFGPPGAAPRALFAWDVFFYATFALVVTSSVRIAGVLLVFSYLIVPAAIANTLAVRLGARLALAWALGAAITALGLLASWEWDLPTGPAIVAGFGTAAALSAIAWIAPRLGLRRIGRGTSLGVAAAGAFLAAFPQADHGWLDALESVAPGVEAAFLEPGERYTRGEALDSIAKARADLARLRALDADARWGKVTLDAATEERLRQYLAGRSEISSGDELVLRWLRGKARDRQRFALGLPLLVVGGAGAYALRRRRAQGESRAASAT